jgi:hypothetical protein
MSDEKPVAAKVFDDGVVEYWRPTVISELSPYRITVQPSGVSIDQLGTSWSGRPCWNTLYSGFSSLAEATVFLLFISHPQKACLIIDDTCKAPYTECVSEDLSFFAARASLCQTHFMALKLRQKPPRNSEIARQYSHS